MKEIIFPPEIPEVGQKIRFSWPNGTISQGIIDERVIFNGDCLVHTEYTSGYYRYNIECEFWTFCSPNSIPVKVHQFH
jgi:hypothetical protein